MDNGSTDGTAAFVRERFPWVRLVRARREPRLCRRQQRRRRARRAAATSRSSTTTRLPSPAGCARCARPRRGGPSRAGDVAHRLHARPGRHRQRRRRAAALGRARSSGITARRVSSAAGVAGSVRRVRRRLPDAEGRVRRARRVRRGLLRVARGRGPLLSGAAARIPLPLRRRRGGAPPRQRHARPDERVRRLSRAAQPRVGVSQEHAGVDPAAAHAAGRTCSTTWPRRRTLRSAGLLVPFVRAKLAALGGLPRVLRQRAVVQRTRRVRRGRSGRTSSRAGWRPSGARSASTRAQAAAPPGAAR